MTNPSLSGRGAALKESGSRAQAAPATRPREAHEHGLPAEPMAIVDIGSNSVRLVVYSGRAAGPSIIFNEKVLAGLGQGLGETGQCSARGRGPGRSPPCAASGCWSARWSVRDVRVRRHRGGPRRRNGDAFLKEVRALGFEPQVISGEKEGELAGRACSPAFPTPTGLVGDLGGGSLELAEMSAAGSAHRASRFRSAFFASASQTPPEKKLSRSLAAALEDSGLGEHGRNRPFYMVGGSWRALARLDIISRDYPLPITHHYRMPPERPAEIARS